MLGYCAQFPIFLLWRFLGIKALGPMSWEIIFVSIIIVQPLLLYFASVCFSSIRLPANRYNLLDVLTQFIATSTLLSLPLALSSIFLFSIISVKLRVLLLLLLLLLLLTRTFYTSHLPCLYVSVRNRRALAAIPFTSNKSLLIKSKSHPPLGWLVLPQITTGLKTRIQRN
ncbi:hypothetical protein BGZ63DRAFT_216200 [Mariannaea sp. PMI_226]|nr:hypothetical protein BGZ63DRAFT_216200 [Mariannaea sp. PMI_226]